MTSTRNQRELPAGAAVGARIHAILWARRQTQVTIAEALGITATTLSKKLRGAVPMTVDELFAIAQVLEVPVADLLPDSTAVPLTPESRAALSRLPPTIVAL